MKSEVMGNVRNLGYVSGEIAVEKLDTKQSSDRISRQRPSVFDIKPVPTGETRQPITNSLTAGARRSLANQRSASS